MSIPDVVDLGRQALWMALLAGAPMLLAAWLVGIAVGLLQAMTQVHDPSISVVPKLIAVTAVLAVSLPWLVDLLVTYSRDLITDIPRVLGMG